MKRILKAIRVCTVLLGLMTLLCGVIYPLLSTALVQILFPTNAHGSLIKRDGKIIGSTLLGQEFTQPQYFWGRLSATSPAYNAAASGGSNLAPANPKLLEAVNKRMAALQKADPKNKTRIPSDLVTASASGLDPDISIDAAMYQIGRVARARHMSEEAVKVIVITYAEWPLLGFWGEPKVNVLTLNLALDDAAKKEK